jgi:hypothetical protein
MKVRTLGALVLALALAIAVFAQGINGKFTGQMAGGRGGPQDVTLTLKASGSDLTGTIKVGQGAETAIEEGKFEGGNVNFKSKQTFGENTFTVAYAGKLAGDDLTLTRTVEGRGGGGGGGGRGGGRGGPQEFTLKRTN